MGTRIRTGTGTRTGSGRAERRRIARNRTRDVDAMWETGDIWVERENNVDKNGVGSVATVHVFRAYQRLCVRKI